MREMDKGDIRDNEREMDTGDIRDNEREMDTGDIRDKGREMDTGDTSDSHKEMACEKAAAEHRWEVVIQLLCDGVSPAEWIISELFENMTPQLLSCFSPGKVHSSVRGPLLQSAVRFGNGDFLLQILHRETVPDRQLMDTIMFAVHLRQGDVLLQLFRCYSRSRRVFKQFFPSQLLSDDEGICWIFNCLDEGGVKDLALCTGTCTKASLVVDFFRSNIADVSMKKQKFRRALSRLYAFCNTNREFYGIARELSAMSQYDRRYIFRFALKQGDFDLAAEVCGPGIRQKDFKLALPEILNECSRIVNEWCVELISKFIRNAEPLFGRECCVQLATQCALERLSDHRTGSDQGSFLFLVLYSMNQDNTFCQRLFRSAVRQFIRNDDDKLFVRFFRAYFRDADLEGNHQLKDDCKFACLKALKAGKYKCIEAICRTGPVGNNPFKRIVLNIVFGRRDLDTLSFLQNVCSLHSVFQRDENDKVFELVLGHLFKSEQWQKHVPAVNKWLTNPDFHCLPCGLLQAFTSMFKTENHARVIMSGKAEWCLRKSYYNLAFVLAFSLQDWNMLEEMLTKRHYCPPFDLRRCIDKVVELGQFSIAVALLRHHTFSFTLLEIRSIKESRKKLADKCLDSGLMTWAVVFTIPDWNRIHTLVQTGQHPDALNVALMGAVTHGQLDFFENLVDRCTDPDRVVKHALFQVDRRKLDYAEKLMNKCTDPTVLRDLLREAAYHGKLEIVKSVIWRVDMNVIQEHLYLVKKKKSIFNDVGVEMILKASSNALQMLCVFVKAGVSTLDRSSVLSHCHCLLSLLLHFQATLQVTLSLGDAAPLMIQSGAVSYRVLDELRRDPCLQKRMETETDESWKQCYTDVVEAAATPSSLQHLARLAVSDAIGCHPGRTARIDSLPIPDKMKDLLYFKDVTEQCCAVFEK